MLRPPCLVQPLAEVVSVSVSLDRSVVLPLQLFQLGGGLAQRQPNRLAHVHVCAVAWARGCSICADLEQTAKFVALVQFLARHHPPHGLGAWLTTSCWLTLFFPTMLLPAMVPDPLDAAVDVRALRALQSIAVLCCSLWALLHALRPLLLFFIVFARIVIFC
jgi:hypothetical protein